MYYPYYLLKKGEDKGFAYGFGQGIAYGAARSAGKILAPVILFGGLFILLIAIALWPITLLLILIKILNNDNSKDSVTTTEKKEENWEKCKENYIKYGVWTDDDEYHSKLEE